MKWYMPTWNGDLRVETDAKRAEHTLLTLHKPTAQERVVADKIGKECVARGWLKSWDSVIDKRFWRSKLVISIEAPMHVVGPVVSKILRPNDPTLTAIKLSDGRVETTSGSLADLEALAGKTLAPYREPAPELAEAPKEPVAATVKRPTPCCPNCESGAIEPATETLLAFLTPDQHDSWSKYRAFEFVGGMSGHRYLIAHRNSKLAIANTRVCRDLDDNGTMHFHDWSVPPEEEVLAAKLILEHREHWLRNEATCLMGRFRDVYKNPFGGGGDGTESALMMRQIWNGLSGRPYHEFFIGAASVMTYPTPRPREWELSPSGPAVLVDRAP